MHKRLHLLAAVLALAVALPGAQAKKAPQPVWQVTRSKDAITGASSCIVAAYDQAGGTSFSRIGALYPFVQNSSVHGVLVGVSGGGRVRLPTGDILWRVDDKPFRTLLAADNPPGVASSAAPQNNPGMKQLAEQQLRLINAATATSTVASGDVAKAMIAEMVGGQGLVFRAGNASGGYGLPTGEGQAVGQITKDGLRPYPLDESFRNGLTACGVTQ